MTLIKIRIISPSFNWKVFTNQLRGKTKEQQKKNFETSQQISVF